MSRTTLSARYRQSVKRRTQSKGYFWNKNHYYNKSQGYAIGLLILISLGLPFSVWAIGYSPYFHSYSQISLPTPHGKDPYNIIFSPSGSTASSFNHVQSSYSSACTANKCELLASTTGQSAVALSSYPIGDLGQVSGKTLQIHMQWEWEGTLTNCCTFDYGWFLTTNSTLPTAGFGPNSPAFYNPYYDPSVQILMLIHPAGGGLGNYLLFLQVPSNTRQSIQQQDVGCEGSHFICALGVSIGTGATGVQNFADAWLNYTSASGSSTNGGVSNVVAGPSAIISTTTILPIFSLSTSPLYLGLYQTERTNGLDLSTLGWDYGRITNGVPQQPSLQIDGVTFTPSITPPVSTIDTGGIFGGIEKFLIQVGVFIAQNLINFLSFLYSLIVPLLAGLAAILGTALISIINAFGGIFGDNHLGTDMNTAFSQIVTYFNNVFASATQIWSNIVTLLLRILNTVTRFLTSSNSFIGFLETFFNNLPSLFDLLNSVWVDFMKYYNSGIFSVQVILAFDWCIGIFETLMKGSKNGFREWLNFNRMITLDLFKGGYWFIDEAYAFVVQLKQLVFGNAVSPVQVAGTG